MPMRWPHSQALTLCHMAWEWDYQCTYQVLLNLVPRLAPWNGALVPHPSCRESLGTRLYQVYYSLLPSLHCPVSVFWCPWDQGYSASSWATIALWYCSDWNSCTAPSLHGALSHCSYCQWGGRANSTLQESRTRFSERLSEEWVLSRRPLTNCVRSDVKCAILS